MANYKFTYSFGFVLLLLGENVGHQSPQPQGSVDGSCSLTVLQEDVRTLKAQMAVFVQHQQMKNEIQALRQELDTLKNKPETPVVVFHVDLQATQCLTRGHKIVWDRIKVNVGNALHTNGSFVCPHNGIYEFTVTIRGDGPVYFSIYRSGNEISVIETRNDQASYTTVTECSRGEEVWVQAMATRRSCASGSCCGRSNFIGKLLFSTQEST